MEDDNELEKHRKEKGSPDMETARQFSPELRMLDLIERLSQRIDENADSVQHRMERVERNFDFIVEQQAKFASAMEKLRESQTRSERRWERTEGSVRNLLSIAQSHEDEMNELRESQKRLVEIQGHTDRQMSETDKRMAETNERINALINIMEQHIGEGRNGGSGEHEV